MNWELEFQRCLDKRWLVRMPEARHLVAKELNVAHDDLAEAEGGYERESYKWSTIQSYYAMFHATRALLYSRGYREKSHSDLPILLRLAKKSFPAQLKGAKGLLAVAPALQIPDR